MSWFSNLVSKVGKGLKSVGSGLYKGIKQVGKSAIKGVKDTSRMLSSAPGEIYKNTLGKAFKKIPKVGKYLDMAGKFATDVIASPITAVGTLGKAISDSKFQKKLGAGNFDAIADLATAPISFIPGLGSAKRFGKQALKSAKKLIP